MPKWSLLTSKSVSKRQNSSIGVLGLPDDRLMAKNIKVVVSGQGNGKGFDTAITGKKFQEFTWKWQRRFVFVKMLRFFNFVYILWYRFLSKEF